MAKQAIDPIGVRPPDSSWIEWQVIYDVIAGDCMAQDVNIVTPDCFSTKERRDIWNACVDVFNSGENVGIMSVSDLVGGAFLDKLYATERLESPSFLNAIPHARMLRDAYTRRKVYQAGLDLLLLSQKPGTDEDALVASVADMAAQFQGESIQKEATVKDILKDVAVKVEKRAKDPDAASGITTGFYCIDKLTPFSGISAGNLVILAARPSVGKTAVMLQMAKAAATRGHHAAIFSLEMTNEELANRLLFSTERVNATQLAFGNVDPHEFSQAVGQLSPLPITVNDKSRTLREIVSRMTILHHHGRCDVAYIDYLGLIKMEDAGRTPLYQVIAEITGTLKAVAKQLEIPIVLLCQLNRDAAKEKDPPQLFHLRDSGGIEQDADMVLMLHPVESLDERPDVQIYVRKNRHGRRDDYVTVHPNESYTAFAEMDFNGRPLNPTEE